MKEYKNETSQNDSFQEGEKFGYTIIVDLIESQAAAFGIKLEDIGFYDYEDYKKRK